MRADTANRSTSTSNRLKRRVLAICGIAILYCPSVAMADDILSISKSATELHLLTGTEIEYTITVANVGSEDVTGIEVVDSLPSGDTVTYVTGSASDGGTFNNGKRTVTWQNLEITNGTSKDLTFRVTVGEGFIGVPITNFVGITTPWPTDTNPDNDTVSTGITPIGTSDLRILKWVDDETPISGQEIEYRISIYNDGPDPVTTLLVYDTLPEGVTYVSPYTASQGTYYPEPGPNVGDWEVGTVPAEDSAVLLITAEVDAGLPANPILNIASIVSQDQDDPIPDNRVDTATINPGNNAELSITKIVDDDTPVSQENVLYTITVANAGPDPATNIIVKDTLPSGVTYIGHTGGDERTRDNNIVRWKINNLAKDANTLLTLTAQVQPGSHGIPISNKAVIDSLTEFDSTPNDSAKVVITPIGKSELTISKTANPSAPVTGQEFEYTITVSNAGPDPATSVVVNDELDQKLLYVGSDPDTYDAPSGNWDPLDVPVSGTVELKITAKVKKGHGNNPIPNTATIAGLDQEDPTPDDSASVDITPGSGADLEVTKSVNGTLFNENQALVYTLTLKNNGPDAATSITITDTFPSSAVSYDSSSGAGSYDNGTGAWTLASLDSNVTVQRTIHATVKPETGGQTVTNIAATTALEETDAFDTYDADTVDFYVNDPPVAICTDRTVDADANCQATVSINNGSYDPDSVTSPTYVLDPPPPYGLGDTLVTLTITDEHGASDQCQATVTVVDNEPPTVDRCQSDTVVNNLPDSCHRWLDWSVDVSDNCTENPDIEYTYNGTTISPPYKFVVGVHTVNVTVTDSVGHENTDCEFTITVNDNEPPSVDRCQSDTSLNNITDSCHQWVDWSIDVSDNCTANPDIEYKYNGSTIQPPYRFDVGVHTVSVTVTDSTGNQNTECSFTITVEDNEPPKITVCPSDTTVSTDPGNGNCNASVRFDIQATDNCILDELKFSHESGDTFPLGETLVEVIAIDDAQNADTCQFSVTVENSPPYFWTCNPPDVITIPNDGNSVDIRLDTLWCDDCDTGSLAFGFDCSLTDKLSCDTDGNVLTVTRVSSSDVLVTIPVSAVDTEGASNTTGVLTINLPLNPCTPQVLGANLTIDEDSSLVDTVETSNPGECTPGFSIEAGPSHGTIDPPLNSATGEYTYIPDSNYNGLDSIRFEACNTSCTTAWTIITINPVNDPPVAVDDAETLCNDDILQVLSPGVLANDTDAENDNLVTVLNSPVSHAESFNFNPDGSYDYNADNNYTGIDTFTYFANDGTLNSEEPATVTITVIACGQPPNAVDDDYEIRMNEPLIVPSQGQECVLANDTDDGTLVAANRLTNPSRGTITEWNAATGCFRYVPQTDDIGQVQFNYEAVDDDSLKDTAMVTIDVLPPCGEPGAFDDNIYTMRDTPFPGQLLADSIPCEGPTTYSVVDSSHNGVITGLPDAVGTYTYTPNTGFVGEDSFTFKITDQYGQESNPKTVSIVVFDLEGDTVRFEARNADCADSQSVDLSGGTETLPIKNNSTVSILVTGLRPDPPSDEFSFPGFSQITILPTTTFFAPASYCPDGLGNDNANIIVEYTISGTKGEATLRNGRLTGRGEYAAISVPSRIDLGDGLDASESHLGDFRIENQSDVILLVDSPEPGDSDHYSLIPSGSVTIEPRGSSTLQLKLTPEPEVFRRYDDTITTRSNAPSSPDFTEVLASAQPNDWNVPDKAQLQNIRVCDCDSSQFTLENVSGSADSLVLDSIQFWGSLDTLLRVVEDLSGQGVGPGKSRTFTLEFCPRDTMSLDTAQARLFYYVPRLDTQRVETDDYANVSAVAPIYKRTSPVVDEMTINVDDTAAAQFDVSFINAGSAPLSLGDCRLVGGDTECFSLVSCPEGPFQPGTGGIVRIDKNTMTARQCETDLVIPSNGFPGVCSGAESDSTFDIIHLVLVIRDTRAPVVDPIFAPVDSGSTDRLEGTVTDDSGVKELNVHISRLDSPPGQIDATYDADLQIPNAKSTTYTVSIPTSQHSALGYDYWFEATDIRNNTTPDTTWYRRDLRFNASHVARPNGAATGALRKNGQWYMISAPGRLVDSSISQVLVAGASLSDATGISDAEDDWRIYSVNPNGDPPGPEEWHSDISEKIFMPGSAYWFRHRSASPEEIIWRLPAGSYRPGESAAGKFSISLNNGWTLFSNPYLFDIYLPVDGTLPQIDGANAIAFFRSAPGGYSNDNSGTTINPQDSNFVGRITFVQFDGSAQRYAVLKPWIGYAIRANGGTVEIDPHPPGPLGSAQSAPPIVSKGLDLNIELSANGALVGQVVCGFGEQAADDWDPSDQPALPLPRPVGMFYVMHNDWGDFSDRYTIDRRAAGARDAVYPLGWSTFHDAGNGEYRLTVKSLDALPNEQSAFLYDRATDVTTELQEGTSYAFHSKLRHDDHRFVLLIGDEAFARQWSGQELSNRPTRYRLLPNYPNPFNAGTVIEFHLTQYSSVKLEVFNILGQKVRTLVDRPMYPGIQRVEFDGTDGQNQPLAAGVYFYRLTTDVGSLSRKMVLLK